MTNNEDRRRLPTKVGNRQKRGNKQKGQSKCGKGLPDEGQLADSSTKMWKKIVGKTIIVKKVTREGENVEISPMNKKVHVVFLIHLT